MKFLAALLIASALPAQLFHPRRAGNAFPLRGHVEMEDGGALRDDLMVELAGATPRLPLSRHGDFEFDAVPEGAYELLITGPHGSLVQREFVWVKESHNYVNVEIRRPRVERPLSGTVSVGQLGYKRIESLNNQALRQLERRQFARAAELLERARALDPSSAIVNTNLAVARYRLERYAEAEEAARRALAADPDFTRGHLMLGLALMALERPSPEALASLRRAAPEFPRARIAAAEILAGAGDAAQAMGELRAYLATSDRAMRDRAESLLALLNGNSTGIR